VVLRRAGTESMMRDHASRDGGLITFLSSAPIKKGAWNEEDRFTVGFCGLS
jgi:hypothetical protein